MCRPALPPPPGWRRASRPAPRWWRGGVSRWWRLEWGLCVFCPLGVWRSVPACPLLCLSSWLSQSPDLLTSFRGQRHSRGLDISILSIFYIQLWSSLVATLTVLASQWRSMYPPQANTVSCLICRPGDLATAWRRWWSVEGAGPVAPLHPAWLSLMPAGRSQQLHC